MRVISISTLRDYWEVHPETRIALSEWYVKVCDADWKSFADIRQDFNAVDYVGNCCLYNQHRCLNFATPVGRFCIGFPQSLTSKIKFYG